MGCVSAVDCVLDLDAVLKMVEQFDLASSDVLNVRLVVMYCGVPVVCDSIDAVQAFVLEAIRTEVTCTVTRT